MGDFNLIGGVGLLGYLSPMDTRDSYAVVDPVYGIDGLRNVGTVGELNLITAERRRAGMIVGVNGGETYYKLKNISNWLFDISDWDELTFKQDYSDKEVPTGEIDGANTIFYLSNTPENNSEHIYLNGLLQDIGGDEDYILEDNKIVFNEAPMVNTKIRCSYRYKNL